MNAPNVIKVSPHFFLCEFEDPTTHTVMLDDALLDALEDARRAFGRPINVTSGYRTVQHNADVGGVPKSRHLLGQAADLVPTEGKIEHLAEACRTVKALLTIAETDHVHVEIRYDPHR